MPLYEYQCDDCGARLERIRKFSDPPLTECPTCGGSLKKLLSSPAIQFKGSGWYITDYARQPESSGGKSRGEPSGAGAKEGKADGAAPAAAPAESSASSSGKTPAATAPAKSDKS
jgi:putative FmdB family regulatory protein